MLSRWCPCTKDQALLTHCASHICPDFPHCLQPSSSPSFEPSLNLLGLLKWSWRGTRPIGQEGLRTFRVSEGRQQDGKGFREHEEWLRSLSSFGLDKRKQGILMVAYSLFMATL